MFKTQSLYLQPGDTVTIKSDGKEVTISTLSYVRVQVKFDPYEDFINYEPIVPADDEK